MRGIFLICRTRADHTLGGKLANCRLALLVLRAAQHLLQLRQLLVAPVIAARLNVIVRDRDLLLRLVFQLRNLLRAQHLRLRRIILFQHPVQRRERLDPRKRQPRALERHVAEIKPHRTRFGDLLHLVEIGCRAGPIADTAEECRARQQDPRNFVADASVADPIEPPPDDFAPVSELVGDWWVDVWGKTNICPPNRKAVKRSSSSQLWRCAILRTTSFADHRVPFTSGSKRIAIAETCERIEVFGKVPVPQASLRVDKQCGSVA